MEFLKEMIMKLEKNIDQKFDVITKKISKLEQKLDFQEQILNRLCRAIDPPEASSFKKIGSREQAMQEIPPRVIFELKNKCGGRIRLEDIFTDEFLFEHNLSGKNGKLAIKETDGFKKLFVGANNMTQKDAMKEAQTQINKLKHTIHQRQYQARKNSKAKENAQYSGDNQFQGDEDFGDEDDAYHIIIEEEEEEEHLDPEYQFTYNIIYCIQW